MKAKIFFVSALFLGAAWAGPKGGGNEGGNGNRDRKLLAKVYLEVMEKYVLDLSAQVVAQRPSDLTDDSLEQLEVFSKAGRMTIRPFVAPKLNNLVATEETRYAPENRELTVFENAWTKIDTARLPQTLRLQAYHYVLQVMRVPDHEYSRSLKFVTGDLANLEQTYAISKLYQLGLAAIEVANVALAVKSALQLSASEREKLDDKMALVLSHLTILRESATTKKFFARAVPEGMLPPETHLEQIYNESTLLQTRISMGDVGPEPVLEHTQRILDNAEGLLRYSIEQ